MSYYSLGETVRVRGISTLHTVECIIPISNKVTIKCTKTGNVLEYIDESALMKLNACSVELDDYVNVFVVGDILKLNDMSSSLYEVVTVNNNQTVDIRTPDGDIHINVPCHKFHIPVLIEQTETSNSIKLGDLVQVKGFNVSFNVIGICGLRAELLYLHTDDTGKFKSHTRLTDISISSIKLVKK